MANFALIGAGGFVAPRHLQAIKDTGNTLLAACDRNDSVGVLDRFFPETAFFTEIERFDRFLEKRKRAPESQRIQWVSICSPNYLHDAHVRLALRTGANALCEKPLVISPWNLDQLSALEAEYGRRVYTVLQLRFHPVLQQLRAELAASSSVHDVCLSYVTRRGPWYQVSWKGSPEKSGGLLMNIGIHFFDLLVWLFGEVEQAEVHLSSAEKLSGVLLLKRARVRWFLSVDGKDLPPGFLAQGKPASRSLQVDGREIEFSEGFGDLHSRVYEATLAGRGFGIEDARPSVELVHRLRTASVVAPTDLAHPKLQG